VVLLRRTLRTFAPVAGRLKSGTKRFFWEKKPVAGPVFLILGEPWCVFLTQVLRTSGLAFVLVVSDPTEIRCWTRHVELESRVMGNYFARFGENFSNLL
jgi:hypothetical protein